MDINKEMQKATQEYLESDKLKKHIQEQAEQMVNKLIDDSFGYFGGIKEQVKEAIEDELKINVKELGIGGFNKFITDVVKKQLDISVKEETEKKITAELEKILTPIEKKVSITKLKEALLDDAYTYDLDICGDVTLDRLDGESGYYEDDVFTFIIEKNGVHDWVDIYLDSRPKKKNYECEWNITVHKNLCSFRHRERGFKATDKAFGYMGEIEALIYNMYLNDSIIDYQDVVDHS